MKNSVDFQAFAPRTPKMRLFFTPKTFALASGLALAMSVWPGQAWAQPAGKLSTAITVDRVSFEQLQDNYSAGNSWMLAKVELTAHSNPDAQAINPKWVKDVSVTLTLGWGTSGTPPQLDLAVAATAKLVAVQVNTSTVVMFFVPPEFLQSGSKNPDGLVPVRSRLTMLRKFRPGAPRLIRAGWRYRQTRCPTRTTLMVSCGRRESRRARMPG